jgi:hypothetical protein
VAADQRQRVVEAVARELAERATGTPAYLIDEETFDGWLRDAEERVAQTRRPELSPLQLAIEFAQNGSWGVASREFCDWVSAALRPEVPA